MYEPLYRLAWAPPPPNLIDLCPLASPAAVATAPVINRSAEVALLTGESDRCHAQQHQRGPHPLTQGTSFPVSVDGRSVSPEITVVSTVSLDHWRVANRSKETKERGRRKDHEVDTTSVMMIDGSALAGAEHGILRYDGEKDEFRFKDADLEGVGTAHGLTEARHSSSLIFPPPLRNGDHLFPVFDRHDAWTVYGDPSCSIPHFYSGVGMKVLARDSWDCRSTWDSSDCWDCLDFWDFLHF